MTTRISSLISYLLVSALTGACSAAPLQTQDVAVQEAGFSAAPGAAALRSSNVPTLQRQLIIRGHLRLEVKDVEATAVKVRKEVERLGGVTEHARRYENGASITARIPSSDFSAAMEALSELGKVLDSSRSEEDVTRQYIDLEAKIANLVALRDRLRALLSRADAVSDIVAVEEQLTRVQIELDQLEGQMRYLKNQIGMSTVTIELKQAKILGPLGLLFKGTYRLLEKLFVLN